MVITASSLSTGNLPEGIFDTSVTASVGAFVTAVDSIAWDNTPCGASRQNAANMAT